MIMTTPMALVRPVGRLYQLALSPPTACIAASLILGVLFAPASAEVVTTPHTYHYQQTNFACGTASIEMMLDSPAVRNNNVNVDNMFINGPGDLDLFNGVQAQIYQASRDRRDLLFNTYGYVGYQPGTDPIEFSYTINAYDGIANGPALPNGVAQGGNPAHSYGWYGYFPNLYSGDQAMRTIAYALKNYQVPAAAAVNHGGHWVVVDGVTTNGTIPTPANPNSQFNITGVYVADPWTGYAITHPGAPGADDLGMGFGNIDPVPIKNLWSYFSYRAWFQAFNPVGGGLGYPYPFSGQYNIMIEPPSNYDAPFDIDMGNYSSEPNYTDLPTPLTAGTALSDAMSEIGAGGDFSFLSNDLSGNPVFTGGSWDSADISFFDFPGDTGGEGDWMIPYLGPGGANDVRGAVAVNSIDGSVDHAMWFGDQPFTLADLTAYYNDYFSLNLPLDIPQGIPEPAIACLFLIGSCGLIAFRRR